MEGARLTPDEKKEILSCLIQHALKAGRVLRNPYNILASSLRVPDKQRYLPPVFIHVNQEFKAEDCAADDSECHKRNEYNKDKLLATLLSNQLADEMKGDEHKEFKLGTYDRLPLLREMNVRTYRDILSNIIKERNTTKYYHHDQEEDTKRLQQILESLQQCSKATIQRRRRKEDQLNFLRALYLGSLGKRPGFQSMEGPAASIYGFL